MSTNIRILRICQHCGKEFEARTTVTKTCSDTCAKRAYKARQRAAKVEMSNQQTQQIKTQPIEDLKAQEFLTVDESAKLIRISRRSLYRLNERGELPFVKLNRRTVIRRSDIDLLFDRPAQLLEQSRPAPVLLSECYTMKEVMQRYGISEKALYELIKRNDIPKQYSGIYAYVPKTRIDELLSYTPIQS
ncbi:helix-turn-helix domain-containing protein [Spirosoma validum]|uniref:Helix-turn-helix domain-containing protein n=1 Tax=Spirosoma validum TaxID=2771355 RepID=A0A927AZ93_9BACT|nr:helix-turn-helix domain-containing protein [Spirosoma validum]MBD2752476.1 helix-turn-helix domain-containing protein [Spirosoma validum]